MLKKKLNKMKACTGCKFCRSGKFPDFSSLTPDEEYEFWAIHPDLKPFRASLLEVKEPVKIFTSKPKKVRISMMIDQALKESLKNLARKKGIGYQTLAHIYIKTAIINELRKAS